ncbi:MAG: response regulator transcription factor [Bacteroidetes bacterium]|nr:response regulator transcription factor [Bacteroidota bacterium]
MQLLENYRIFIADPHPFFRRGLRQYLEEESRIAVSPAYETGSGKELLQALRANVSVLLLMELNLRDVDGFEVLKKIRQRRLPVKVLIVSAYRDSKLIKQAMKYGAAGYILKESAEGSLPEAILGVLKDENHIGEGVQLNNAAGRNKKEEVLKDSFARKHLLTRRELEVLKLISDALSNKEIAKRLYISDQTVGVHRKNIMRKLGVNNVAELMRKAFDHSLI